jgi:DUF4097 and DUF4098 domain-containing protein YvlB
MSIRVTSTTISLVLLTSAYATGQSPQRDVFVVYTANYQDRGGSEQTERFSQRVKLAPEGRFSIANLAGDVSITGGSGDEVMIEAVKRTRGNQGRLAGVDIQVEERSGRVDVRTRHRDPSGRVRVDYTIRVPLSASVDARLVFGSVTVSGVRGVVRAESVSGNVTTTGTPQLEVAKSVSGDVVLSGADASRDLAAASVSGTIRAKGLKLRGLDLNTVSGDIMLSGVTCDRLNARSVSGSVEYAGALTNSGQYDINSHSGAVRLELTGDVGFELDARSFSGSTRSDLPMTLSAGRNARPGSNRGGIGGSSIQATFGNGSAMVTVRTFSGDVIISRGR